MYGDRRQLLVVWSRGSVHRCWIIMLYTWNLLKKNKQSFFFHSRSEVKIKVTARPYSLLSLLAFGGSRCSLACGCITPSPSFIFTWPSSLLQSSSLLSQTPLCLSHQGTLVIGFRDHPDNLRRSHLNILNLQRSFFQIKYYSITGSRDLTPIGRLFLVFHGFYKEKTATAKCTITQNCKRLNNLLDLHF